MNTDKIHILLEAIEEGSLTAAAEKLHFTPSGVSRAVESLEQELGAELLLRSKEGVKPTELCRLLLPDMRQLFDAEKIFREHAGQLAGGEAGTIRIGTAYAPLYPWLAGIIASFRDVYPKVCYEMKYGYSSDLLAMTASGSLDCCIISRREWSGGWATLLTDELVALLPPGHRYAQASRVPIKIFSEEPYISVHPGGETDNTRMFRARHISPRRLLSTEDSAAMYSMIEAGLGIGLNNRINTRHYRGNISILPLAPPQPIEIGIAHSLHALPAVTEFIRYAVSAGLPSAAALPQAGVPGR